MPAEKLQTPSPVNSNDPRVICSNSLEHLRITSLSGLGISSQDIETITGFSKSEFQHLVRE